MTAGSRYEERAVTYADAAFDSGSALRVHHSPLELLTAAQVFATLHAAQVNADGAAAVRASAAIAAQVLGQPAEGDKAPIA